MSNFELNFAKELWYELVNWVNPAERADAADVFVSLLVDHDIAPQDIRTEFKNDSEIMDVVTNYLKDEHFEEEEPEEDIEDYFDIDEDY